MQPDKNTKLLKIDFPENLPVSREREAISQALREHPVVIVCGETGSGKTTQLAKICLTMGRGRANGTGCLIGHTQPRRIAATATAKRIAQELGSPLGEDVGYQVRFSDQTSQTASIKLMTDGILLAETQKDPLLKQYDTLIIDEAHERSLNIDFLLGYLKQLLPRRPDLKVIITSATIDARRFSEHFAHQGQPAPVIEVSGRLFPVELRYRPLLEPGKKEAQEIPEAVVAAIHELWSAGAHGLGDVLVFLPGEREIRDCAEALRKDPILNQRYQAEILSLFARQSIAEQERVFRLGSGRRIVLATNVAETSLTVPGIRYVIDTGLARVKRYSYRNKVEQLQVEPISQAAANQRAGRCGRVADGICIRLYDEADFQARAAYTDPEILRSSLAAVILRMRALKLARIQDFPFIDPPQGKAIADGVQLLEELGAMESQGPRQGALTPLGKQLARLPLDPRLGRILLAAQEHQALREVLIIASALSSQDPRDRPMDRQEQADRAHRLFIDEKSEFLGEVKLWDWYQEALEHKQSHRQLEQLCKTHFISPRRMREWRDVHGQLHRLLSDMGWKENQTPATYEQIHLSLLSGLLGHVLKRADEDKAAIAPFEGARGVKLHLWPGQTLGKKTGHWLLAAELVETSRLFARKIAKIEPQWIEKVAAHRIQKQWSEPYWDPKQGEVMAHERGNLYGLSIYHGRKVRFGPKDPALAREIFIRQALLEQNLFPEQEAIDLQKKLGAEFSFYWHNKQLIKEIEALEHRSRRQDVLVHDELIYAFYDQHIPHDVFGRVDLQSWLRTDKDRTKLLRLSKDDLMRHEAAGVTIDRYPKSLEMSGNRFDLTYHFEPGSPKDGVTLIVPLAFLNQVDARRCEWLVPGLSEEKSQLLLKSLPQKIRRHCVPLPQFAKDFLNEHLDKNTFGQGDFLDALIQYIRQRTQVQVQRTDFRPENLPPYTHMNFRLVDEYGRQIELERNLAQLRSQYSQQARAEFQGLAEQGVVSQTTQNTVHVTSEQTVSLDVSEPITTWSFGELPELLEIKKGQKRLYGYPALKDAQSHCDLEVFDDPELARIEHFKGLRRLFALQMKDSVKALQKQLAGSREMGLLFMQIGSVEQLAQEILNMAIERSCMQDPMPKNQVSFNERAMQGRAKLGLIAQEIAKHVLLSLQAHADVQKRLSQIKVISPSAHADMTHQLQGLIYPQFLINTPYESLVHLPRYLKGMNIRIDKLRNNLVRDAQLQKDWFSLFQPWQKKLQGQKAYGGQVDPRLLEFRWQLEELRVALYAQELRTPTPISVKRLQKVLESIQ